MNLLQQAEARIATYLDQLAANEGVKITTRRLARFEPVDFDPSVVDLVENVIRQHGHSGRRLPSGAGHDAQMLARVCPTAMIFTQSHLGISHNPAEYTSPQDLADGTNILLDVIDRKSTRLNSSHRT